MQYDSIMKDFFELIRWNHWAKNVFVLAPLFFSGDYYDIGNVAQVLKAFFIFCLVSSCVYIFNDLLDFEADSAHNKKRLRPLPSGRISKPMAVLILSIMFISACLLLYTLRMPINFIYVVLLYTLINLIYSTGLKHIPVLELMLVSSGFVLRLVGGGEALSIVLSPWIIVATASLSLLITVAKRRSDLVQKSDPEEQRASLTGYNVEFLNSLLSILVSVTIVVYVIFSISDYATERHSQFIIFSSIPVLIGMFRFLQLAIVFERGDFPTELITRDKGMVASILLFVCIFILTTFVGDI